MRLPDPRSYGSKNPGATNVLRTGSKAAAVLTLAGDAGKGGCAVWLAVVLHRPKLALAGLGRVPRPPLPGVPPLPGRQGRGHRGGRAVRARLARRPRHGGHLARDRRVSCATRRSPRWSLRCSRRSPPRSCSAGRPRSSWARCRALLVWRHKGNIARLARRHRAAPRREEAYPVRSQRGFTREAMRCAGSLSSSLRRGGKGDHRAVVGAELGLGIEHVEAAPRRLGIERGAQLPVGADAAGDDQPGEPGGLERAHALRDQHLHDRVDEGARQVGRVRRSRSSPASAPRS